MALNAISKSKLKTAQLRGRTTDPGALVEIQELLGDRPRRKDLLIKSLHLIQDKYHQLSSMHLIALAEELKLAISEVYEVATFYHHFDAVKEDDPLIPKLTIRVCNLVTCEIFGSGSLTDELKEKLGDQVRIQAVLCVGRCHDAPVAYCLTPPFST